MHTLSKHVILLSVFLLYACSPGEEQRQASPAEQKQEQESTTTPTETETETERLNEWFDQQFEAYLDFSPLARSALGDKKDYDKLDDVSEAALDKRLAWRRNSVEEMKSRFDRGKLNREGKISWDLWIYLLERAEAEVPFRRHEYIFGRYGPQSGLPSNLISYHKVDTPSDMEDYVSRLQASGRYMRQYFKRAQRAAADGIRAPYFDYERAISEAERVISGSPFTDNGTSPLWEDINRKMDGLLENGDITKEQAESLKADAKDALMTELKPAYDDIIAWLEKDLEENVPEQATGAWNLPEGEAYYDYALTDMTTLPLTADEIHQTGLKEVARLHKEMEAIKDEVEFDGSLNEFFNYMREDEEFNYPNTDEGREAYLEQAREYITQVEKKLSKYFGILPKADVKVRRVEAFREQDGGAAHYRRGTPDGSRPGIFYAHLSDMNAVAGYRLENLTYHEALPGHHMQISIQQELDNVPRFRTYHDYTAYTEGWGLYSEYLGKEMGFYQNPYSDFGRLSGELWRAIRLVVDTGIHAKKWTEQEAIDYAAENSPKPKTAVKSEVHRYFNNPAQATAYKVGMLKILELREKAKQALDDKFDIRSFHDEVLGSGPLPLPILEGKIDAWIQRSGSSSGN